jgi:trigger factor
VKEDIALQAIANREDLNISDEELDATLLEYAQNYGYSTIEEYIGDTSKEDYREYLMMNNVLQFLMDNAVVSE